MAASVFGDKSCQISYLKDLNFRAIVSRTILQLTVIFLGYLLFPLIFMAIGVAVAKAKGRGGFGWGLLCFLLGPIGLIWLLLLSDLKSPTLATALPAQPAQPNKWSVLKEVDPEIRKAADHLAGLSPALEVEFSEKYLQLGDKSYLEALVKSVEAKFFEDQARTAVAERMQERRLSRHLADEMDEPNSGTIGPYYFIRTKLGEYVVTKNDTFVGRAASYTDLVRRFSQ